MTANSGSSNQKTQKSAAGKAAGQADQSTTAPTLDAASVATWLKSHPKFFRDHSELLLHLQIPHESGKAISLLERQVSVFRERHQHMDEQLREIIANARENDVLFEVTRMVILDLLRSTSLDALEHTIANTLKADLEADAARLVFVVDQDTRREGKMPSLPATAVRTALGELYQKQRTWCGRLNKVQQQLLFKGSDEAIVSAAIVPLHLAKNSVVLKQFGQPLLLVGSTEAQHFNSSLGTLFLDFIGEVLAVHLEQLAAAAAETQTQV